VLLAPGFEEAEAIITVIVVFSVDVTRLFRHFYIWTSKRIEVHDTTNNDT
jgi:hypothetical protein